MVAGYGVQRSPSLPLRWCKASLMLLRVRHAQGAPVIPQANPAVTSYCWAITQKATALGGFGKFWGS